MANCRFLHLNHLDDPASLKLSSALPGLVGMPAPRTLGGAVCYATGRHSGLQDQVFLVEIDSTLAGEAVGQATFRWRRGDASGWEAAGVPTSTNLVTLADGVMVKWVSGGGTDFVKGDSWRILAVRGSGAAALLDGDRDTAWRATGAVAEYLRADLGTSTSVRALALADHNLQPTATARLLANDDDAWTVPFWGADLRQATDAWPEGDPGVSSRSSAGWYLDADGLWRQAAEHVARHDHQEGSPHYLCEPERKNLVTNHNANPTNLDATSGPEPPATLTLVDDSAELAASGLAEICPGGLVYKLDNSAGAVRAYVAISGGTVNLVDPHTHSAFYRGGLGSIGTSGVGANLFLPESAHYARAVWTGVPVGSGRVCMGAEAGQTIYFILPQLEKGDEATSPIVTAGDTATRRADQLAWPLTPAQAATLSVDAGWSESLADQTGVTEYRCSFISGASFAQMEGRDLSPLATAQGARAHALILRDAAGHIAWGYLGEAGGGQTLGTDLLVDGDFDGDPAGAWQYSGVGWTVSGGQAVGDNTSGSASYLYQVHLGLAGALLQYSLDVTAYTSGTGELMLGASAGEGPSWSASGSLAGYRAWGRASDRIELLLPNGACYSLDDLTVRQVLSPEAHGVWVYDAPQGGSRSWAGLAREFDFNDIVSFDAVPAEQANARGTLWLEAVPGADGPAYLPMVSLDDEALFYLNNDGYLKARDRTAATELGLEWQAGDRLLAALRWSTDQGLYQVGCSRDAGQTWLWGAAQSFAGAFPAADQLRLGPAGANHPLRLGRLALAADWLDEADLNGFFLGEMHDLTVTSPHLVAFLEGARRYWRLELADPDNPDGALRASELFLGDYLEPSHSFESRYTRAAVAGRALTATDAGKVAGSSTGLSESLTLKFPRLKAEDVTALKQMLAQVHDPAGGAVRPLIFTPFADRPGDALICLPGPDLNFQRVAADRWSLDLTLEEVVRTDA